MVGYWPNQCHCHHQLQRVHFRHFRALSRLWRHW